MYIRKKAVLKNILKEEAKWMCTTADLEEGRLEEDHLLGSQHIG